MCIFFIHMLTVYHFIEILYEGTFTIQILITVKKKSYMYQGPDKKVVGY